MKQKVWEKEAAEADEELKKLLGEEAKKEEGNTEVPPEGNTPPEDAPKEGTEPPAPEPDKGEVKPDEGKLDEGTVPPDIKTEYEKLQAENTKLLSAHSVLQGKYNAEVPRLYDEIGNLKKEIEGLKASGPAKEPEKPKGEISKRLAEEYGDEFVSDIKNLLMEDLKAEIGAELKPVKDKIDGVTAATAGTIQERFMRDLTTGCPEWKQIRDDPNFVSFLSGIDPFTGRTRHELAIAANEQMDAGRVAEFYKAFKSSPLYKKLDTSTPTKKDKEKFLTPNTAKGGGAETITDDTTKKTYSRTVVDTFFRELPKNRRLNLISEADARKLEQEYTLAEQEGRIR